MMTLKKHKQKKHSLKNKLSSLLKKPSQFPISNHCDGHHFFNPSGSKPKTLKDIGKWKLNDKLIPWPKWVDNVCQPEIANHTTANEIVLTFINHVSFLIQTANLNILTDPVFSKRASPSQLVGPKRVRHPGIEFNQLPKIDLVLISHNHYDHMDLPTIAHLEKKFQPHFIVPLGNRKILEKAGVKNISEMDWWQRLRFQHIEVITVPAKHWSRRGLRDTNRMLWAGFVLQTENNKIYFSGDTGYGEHFKEIHQQLGAIDLALLPIGSYEPRWFMQEMHMNPDDAVRAHNDLQAHLSIGMHFGTFQLTNEGIDEPIKDLQLALDKYNVKNFNVLEVGETRQI